MGEAFYGFPNRMQSYGSSQKLLWMQVTGGRNEDMTSGVTPSTPRYEYDDLHHHSRYDPNQALSAYYGYKIATEYLNRKGGKPFCMEGTLYSKNISPNINGTYSIGAQTEKFSDIWASRFNGSLVGNADTASKLKTARKIIVKLESAGADVSSYGEETFDGSKDIRIFVDTPYLHLLEGGTVVGRTNFMSSTYTRSIIPYTTSADNIPGDGSPHYTSYNIGSYSYRYNTIYAKYLYGDNFYGNSNTATKFKNPVKITVDVSPSNPIQGSAILKGDEGDGVTNVSKYGIVVKTCADGYLPKSGGFLNKDGYISRSVFPGSFGGLIRNTMLRVVIEDGQRNPNGGTYFPVFSTSSLNGYWELGNYYPHPNYDTIHNKDILKLTYMKNRGGELEIYPSIEFKPSGGIYGSDTVGAGRKIYTTGLIESYETIYSHGVQRENVFDNTYLCCTCASRAPGIDSNPEDRAIFKIMNSNRNGTTNAGADSGYRYMCFNCSNYQNSSSSDYLKFDRMYHFTISDTPILLKSAILGTLRRPVTDPSNITTVVNSNGSISYTHAFGTGAGVVEYTNNFSFEPTVSGGLTLGTGSKLWGQVYSTSPSISQSDRNLKEQIQKIPDVFKKVYTSILPVVYHWKQSEDDIKPHDRQHAGFISQDVEKALTENGLTTMDFGGVCIDKYYPNKKNPLYNATESEIMEYLKTHPDCASDDNVINTSDPYLNEQDTSKDMITRYGFRYEEVVPLNTYMIQQLMAKVDQLEVMAGIKEELDYPELLDPNRYSRYENS